MTLTLFLQYSESDSLFYFGGRIILVACAAAISIQALFGIISVLFHILGKKNPISILSWYCAGALVKNDIIHIYCTWLLSCTALVPYLSLLVFPDHHGLVFLIIGLGSVIIASVPKLRKWFSSRGTISVLLQLSFSMLIGLLVYRIIYHSRFMQDLFRRGCILYSFSGLEYIFDVLRLLLVATFFPCFIIHICLCVKKTRGLS